MDATRSRIGRRNRRSVGNRRRDTLLVALTVGLRLAVVVIYGAVWHRRIAEIAIAIPSIFWRCYTGQIRVGQVRTTCIRPAAEVCTGQVRACQDRVLQFRVGQVGTG